MKAKYFIILALIPYSFVKASSDRTWQVNCRLDEIGKTIKGSEFLVNCKEDSKGRAIGSMWLPERGNAFYLQERGLGAEIQYEPGSCEDLDVILRDAKAGAPMDAVTEFKASTLGKIKAYFPRNNVNFVDKVTEDPMTRLLCDPRIEIKP